MYLIGACQEDAFVLGELLEIFFEASLGYDHQERVGPVREPGCAAGEVAVEMEAGGLRRQPALNEEVVDDPVEPDAGDDVDALADAVLPVVDPPAADGADIVAPLDQVHAEEDEAGLQMLPDDVLHERI